MGSSILQAKLRPTAVVATNDVFAVGGHDGISIGRRRDADEVSITDVDNTDIGATQTPGLTSIRTPMVEVANF